MHISAVMCILNFYLKKYKKNYFFIFYIGTLRGKINLFSWQWMC